MCVMSLFTTLTTQSTNTVLSLYAQSLGATLSVAGTLVGISSVACIVMLPISGPASNRINKRVLVQWSLIICVIGNIGFAMAHSIPVLMICRFVIGLSQGLANTATMVMVTESLPVDKVTIGVGYYGLAGTLMQSVGPAIALRISENYGYAVLFIVVAAMCVVNYLLGFLLPDSEPVIQERFTLRSIKLKEIVAPEALVPAIIGFLFAFNNGVQLAFIAPYAVDMEFGGVGLYFTIQSVFIILARLFLGHITNVRKVSFATTFSGCFLLAFALLLGFGRSSISMYIAGGCFGLAYGTLLPVTQSVSVKLVPPERKGSGSSTYFLGIFTALAMGGTVGGVIADHFGYQAMFLSLTVPTICAIVLALVKANFPVSPEAYKERRSTRKTESIIVPADTSAG